MSLRLAGLALLLCLSLHPLSVSARQRTHPFDPSAPPKNPNPPSPAEMKERNERRFPGEWFPEGFDVGEPATHGTASSTTKWQSKLGQQAYKEPRIWYDEPEGTPRPPGKLLLNMLVRNEAENLARTLPRWAKIADYWIIGVDEKNDDDSEAIIKKYLGHLPGEIALVKGFDGHGPTWTTLVDIGIKNYPGATHGIMADADFSPMIDSLDKNLLDIRCSKHMYTIWTSDHRNERKMDWVYRNIPGAKISRRTHQVIEVPILPDQEVFQTLLPLAVDEREGGYGDRSGNKQERYIAWMAADLLDFPDDPRTLYYLGYGHLDLYNSHGGTPEAKHMQALDRSVYYFDRRVDLPAEIGNKEERWFAMLKLAEVHERYYQDWQKAEKYYHRCAALDTARSDPYFYLGQHFRLVSDPDRAEPFLYTAATLPVPNRSLFNWHYLYSCLGELEYGRNWLKFTSPTLKQTKRALRLLRQADCSQGDPGNSEEVARLISTVRDKLNALKKAKKAKKRKAAKKAARKAKREAEEAAEREAAEAKEKEEAAAAGIITTDSEDDSPVRPLTPRQTMTPKQFVDSDEKIGTVRQALKFLVPQVSAFAGLVQTKQKSKDAQAEAAVNVLSDLAAATKQLSDYMKEFRAIVGKKKSHSVKRADFLTCKRLRAATRELVRIQTQADTHQIIQESDHMQIAHMCRQTRLASQFE